VYLQVLGHLVLIKTCDGNYIYTYVLKSHLDI